VPTVQPPDPIPGARLLFSLDPAVSHLNHGSFGAVPLAVQRAQQRLRDEVEANPVRFYADGSLEDRIAAVRRHLATFVGLDPAGCAVVPNATTGASIVLGSLGFGHGDEIITTDHGYGAVALAVDRICRETGAVAREIPVALTASDDEVVTAVRSAVTGRTRLVVLSACETGLGKEVKGEGLMSLTRAFMYAGTPSVVVSLWNVNDESAADLMIRFYRNLKTGMSKGEALRQAQLETIRDNGFPFFWAPFVLVGIN